MNREHYKEINNKIKEISNNNFTFKQDHEGYIYKYFLDIEHSFTHGKRVRIVELIYLEDNIASTSSINMTFEQFYNIYKVQADGLTHELFMDTEKFNTSDKLINKILEEMFKDLKEAR